MWQFHNPVKICFGSGKLEEIKSILQGRCYVIVTYDHSYFEAVTYLIKERAQNCVAVLNQVSENPDLGDLTTICQAFQPYQSQVEVIVALGGGSIIDTAKALAVAGGNPEIVRHILLKKMPIQSALPIIAIPTTTGTGSEVTSWATLWDKGSHKKYSLSDPKFYPEVALCDPHLTLELPRSITIQTGLDALSHALESIWNKNRNPISLQFAKKAILSILETLPALIASPQNLRLREQMMLASLNAGYAFSNTKTSIAHNISYAVTLERGIPHGIACAFTLPVILQSFAHSDGAIAEDLRMVFGDDLVSASKMLGAWIASLGISLLPQDYGYGALAWENLVLEAFVGERGQNFSGDREVLQKLFQQQLSA